MLVIRLAVAVATLGLLSSIPAAGQAKLSTQQLNSSTLNVNKPIAAPNKPITVLSPNLNKSIAAPKAATASGTVALQGSVLNHDLKPQGGGRKVPAHVNGPDYGAHGLFSGDPRSGNWPAAPPCPGGTSRNPSGSCS